jgi:potassium-transporting ATPase KdpC subunit
MRRQLLPAVLMVVVFTVVFGLAYPLVITGISQFFYPDKANGSLVEVDGRSVGSSLIGQAWVDEDGEPLLQYFQSRPSAATGANGDAPAGYDPTLSLGANLGPTNPELRKQVAARVREYRRLNQLDVDTPIPVDAVTSSASGLDPHVSEANARLQTRRVAEERDVPVRVVRALVADHVEDRQLGFLGERRVNVLLLNLVLDRLEEARS